MIINKRIQAKILDIGIGSTKRIRTMEDEDIFNFSNVIDNTIREYMIPYEKYYINIFLNGKFIMMNDVSLKKGELNYDFSKTSVSNEISKILKTEEKFINVVIFSIGVIDEVQKLLLMHMLADSQRKFFAPIHSTEFHDIYSKLDEYDKQRYFSLKKVLDTIHLEINLNTEDNFNLFPIENDGTEEGIKKAKEIARLKYSINKIDSIQEYATKFGIDEDLLRIANDFRITLKWERTAELIQEEELLEYMKQYNNLFK